MKTGHAMRTTVHSLTSHANFHVSPRNAELFSIVA